MKFLVDQLPSLIFLASSIGFAIGTAINLWRAFHG